MCIGTLAAAALSSSPSRLGAGPDPAAGLVFRMEIVTPEQRRIIGGVVELDLAFENSTAEPMRLPIDGLFTVGVRFEDLGKELPGWGCARNGSQWSRVITDLAAGASTSLRFSIPLRAAASVHIVAGLTNNAPHADGDDLRRPEPPPALWQGRVEAKASFDVPAGKWWPRWPRARSGSPSGRGAIDYLSSLGDLVWSGDATSMDLTHLHSAWQSGSTPLIREFAYSSLCVAVIRSWGHDMLDDVLAPAWPSLSVSERKAQVEVAARAYSGTLSWSAPRSGPLLVWFNSSVSETAQARAKAILLVASTDTDPAVRDVATKALGR